MAAIKRASAQALAGGLAVTAIFFAGEVGAAGVALEAGELTVASAGMQALHASAHAGVHAGASAALAAYWGWTFKESYQNNKEFLKAVDDCR